MVVALCAFESGAKENGSSCVHAVDYLIHAILFRVRAGLDVAGRCAMETGGDPLGRGGAGQHVAGNLLNDKLVKWHSRVESINYPIPISPTVADLVGLEAITVGIARKVQPWACPAFAIAG